ncbi:hypothetical protein FH972_024061 [Carpinus fangiana]|uniref:Uncharacterized protein n=1 Tax=Carpinus fangiana TaxID=176857 RepID=A0A5N6KXM2_9ROSI|nr:hypothetical protein FH972_024061 [Carpinus fangiana]
MASIPELPQFIERNCSIKNVSLLYNAGLIPNIRSTLSWLSPEARRQLKGDLPILTTSDEDRIQAIIDDLDEEAKYVRFPFDWSKTPLLQAALLTTLDLDYAVHTALSHITFVDLLLFAQGFRRQACTTFSQVLECASLRIRDGSLQIEGDDQSKFLNPITLALMRGEKNFSVWTVLIKFLYSISGALTATSPLHLKLVKLKIQQARWKALCDDWSLFSWIHLDRRFDYLHSLYSEDKYTLFDDAVRSRTASIRSSESYRLPDLKDSLSDDMKRRFGNWNSFQYEVGEYATYDPPCREMLEYWMVASSMPFPLSFMA